MNIMLQRSSIEDQYNKEEEENVMKNVPGSTSYLWFGQKVGQKDEQ